MTQRTWLSFGVKCLGSIRMSRLRASMSDTRTAAREQFLVDMTRTEMRQ